ncbi:MAG: efflux RND transporter periplasmic adaptor subunit [Verrucomicrobia bacterium]|nr:efflux RND transporter periplasmic adaptor subunit [Verrucomicrobiota bacterium]
MKKLFAIVVVLLLLSLGGVSIWYLQQQRPASSGVSGTIEVDEVRVASRYGGRVEKIFVQEGDALKTGQVLVELEAAELRARREQAAALLAEWEAGPRAEEIAAAKGEWEALLAEMEFVRGDEKRARELFAQKAISETERDRASTKLRGLEKSTAAAKARHDLLIAGTRPERLAQARAQLAEIDAQLREMKIVAPTNAVLEVLSVKIGDVLPPNREAATLLLTGHLWVRVFVPETWLGQIQVGQKTRVRVDSFPGKDFAGIVEQIGRAAEFTPRNVQTVEERVKQVFGVKVRLENEQDQLRGGMSADVFFPSVPK